MGSMNRDIERIVRTLQRPPYGCSVRRTRTGHYVVSLPGKQPVTVATSPSDRRGLANTKADIRRHLGISL